MLVDSVTAPLRPLWLTISLSRSTFSGLAFSTCGGGKNAALVNTGSQLLSGTAEWG